MQVWRCFASSRTTWPTLAALFLFYEGGKVGAQVSWQDIIYRDQGAGITTRQDDYALVDLMASYDISDSLTASLNINNITDEKYLTSLFWTAQYRG